MSERPLTRGEARERAALLHDVAYVVDLSLDPHSDVFETRTVVTFGCRRPGASTFIDLTAESLGGAVLNGRPVVSGLEYGALVALDGLEERNRLEITARCAYSASGAGLHRFRDPVDGGVYVYSQMEPFNAHRVFACFDQPDLRAPLTLRVDGPPEWCVAANGAPAGETPPSETRRAFATTPAIPPYLAAVAAGPWHVETSRHRDVDLGLWCRRSLAGHLDPDELFDLTGRGLDHFEALFDHPYAFGKYDQVFVPEFDYGAMENPGCVTFSEHYIFRSAVTEADRQGRADTLLHEMAHMWFGDLVTMRWWDDLWLNESFATYMATFAQGAATRFTEAWLRFGSEVKSWALMQDQLPSTHPILADTPDTDAVRVNFDGITYAKGAAVLRQLAAWVGDGAFRDGVRAYIRRHRFGNAELGDLLAALEEASGRDLRTWSREWLETSGVTTLRPDATEADGRYTRFAVVQEAHERAAHRPHRVAVGLYDDDGDSITRRKRVELDVLGATTEVPELAGEPVADLVVVNDDDLSFVKLRVDPRSVATLLAGLSRVRPALTRSLCWSAAWDMTRDAELPARRWVELVARHAPADGDTGALRDILGRAARAIDAYVHPSNRGASRHAIAEVSRVAMAAAPPGSEQQLEWARSLVRMSRTPAELAFLRALLDGEEDVPGLRMDTDLRWQVVGALAAAGAAGDAVVDDEVRRDPTDIGERHAASARASMPRAAAKAAAWERLAGERGMTLATMGAVLEGFDRPDQDDLLRPYLSRYVDTVGRAWSERTPEEAIALTRGLYPAYMTSDDVLAAADAALEARLPPEGRRLVLEARDQTLRSRRAQEVDACST